MTPDVMWEGAALSAYDASDQSHLEHEEAMNALQRSLMSAPCRA